VVALFGPTHEAFGFVPRGERVRVISRALACRPCTVHGGLRCPRKRRACLDDIAPAEVLAAARELLAHDTGASPRV
jgi:heptosyltransferase-2